MSALIAILYFGCFIVSLTLAPENLQMAFAITSIVLLTATGFLGIWRGPF